MDEKNFKRLLDEAIEPLRDDLTGVKEDLTGVKESQTGLQSNIEQLQVAVSEMQDTLDNRVLLSVIETEVTIKSYADAYKINKGNIERLDERLTTVEDQLDIHPSDQLVIQR